MLIAAVATLNLAIGISGAMTLSRLSCPRHARTKLRVRAGATLHHGSLTTDFRRYAAKRRTNADLPRCEHRSVLRGLRRFRLRPRGCRATVESQSQARTAPLGEVIELAVRAEVQDLDHRWDVAAPRHLLEELSRGNPSQEQLDTYRSLREAWLELGIEEHGVSDIEMVNAVETRLRRLSFRDPPDRRHLAEAIAIGASWFITLDKDIIKKTRDEPTKPTKIEGVIVGLPSELRTRMTFDLVLGLRLAEARWSQISIAIAGRGFLEENLSGSPKAEARAGAVVE